MNELVIENVLKAEVSGVPPHEVYSKKAGDRLAPEERGRVAWWKPEHHQPVAVICVYDGTQEKYAWAILAHYRQTIAVVKAVHRAGLGVLRYTGKHWRLLRAKKQGTTIIISEIRLT